MDRDVWCCEVLRFQGKEMINHVETSSLHPPAIIEKGLLPAGIGFDSYHIAFYAYVILETLTGFVPHIPV